MSQASSSAHVAPFRSVDAALKAFGGAGPGFDFWRFFLAASILFLHSYHVAYGAVSPQSQWIGAMFAPFFIAILPIFFALSGFLVTGSAIRTTRVQTFLLFRACRLVPALTVEVMLCTLVLGPLLTNLPLHSYFGDQRFYAYFGNIVGRIRFTLPGLFSNNPVPNTVNVNLWTLHAELECYAIMTAAILSGLLLRRRIALALWLVATLIMTIADVRWGSFSASGLYPPQLWVYGFCTGSIAFLWRDRIPLNGWLAALLALLSAMAVREPHLAIVNVILLTYIMIWVGLQPRLAFKIFRKGDYSYGLYLYGYPIQQTIVFLFPDYRTWWFVFLVSAVLTLFFAIVSWHLIEKPALRLKKIFSNRNAAIPGSAGKIPHTISVSAQQALDRAEARG